MSDGDYRPGSGSYGFVTKKCPECYTHLPLQTPKCPSCKVRLVGLSHSDCRYCGILLVCMVGIY
jgi:hypothetical protein